VRIGIECSTLTRSRAGIGFYTYHLVRALARREGEEEFVLLYNRPLPPMELPSRLRHVLNGPSSTHLWAQTRLASICRRQEIDVLHSTGQCIPLLYGGKTILTVHDISPMLFPRQKEIASRIIWNSIVPMMARQADHVIAVSDNTRRDVIERLGVPEHRVSRIYEAAAPEYYPETDPARLREFRRRESLENGYILAVSTLEPRKNYPFLFRIFARWLRRSKTDAVLVVVGKKGWLYDEIFAACEALQLHRQVRFVDYIGDLDRLRLFYSAAQFSILTPWYEGFWLPGLESLACGTPVIAPKHSSIPEVVGDAGILIDNWDEETWTAAMDRLWRATDRESWSRRGIEQARKFSWDRAASETLAIYRKVAEGDRRS